MNRGYYLKENLKLMLNVFYRPRKVISFFLVNVHPLYWLLPMLMSIIIVEATDIFIYWGNLPFYRHFFAHIIGMPNHSYDLVEIFILPIVNALTFLLFGLIVHILSGRRISGLKAAQHRLQLTALPSAQNDVACFSRRSKDKVALLNRPAAEPFC